MERLTPQWYWKHWGVNKKHRTNIKRDYVIRDLNLRDKVQHSPSRRIWGQASPRSSRNLSNLFVARDFVNMSAIMSDVGQYLLQRNVARRDSLPDEMKMNVESSSICLVRPWKVESWDNRIAPWLSQNKVVGVEKEKIRDNSVRNLWIHRISFEACVSATYSASVLDNVTIGCFLQLQETIPDPIK